MQNQNGFSLSFTFNDITVVAIKNFVISILISFLFEENEEEDGDGGEEDE